MYKIIFQSYDQPQKTRKCLLQKSDRMNNSMVKMMESPSPFEIYLCDNCDAELYSEDAMKEHEKMCASDDDDVIFCDSPLPEEVSHRPQEADSTTGHKNSSSKNKAPIKLHTSPIKTCDAQEQRQNFLLNFFLKPKGCSQTYTQLREASERVDDVKLSSKPSNSRSHKRAHRGRTRGQTMASTLSRCPTIPISSPAGQFLAKKSKTAFTTDYLNERLDRLERFCAASPLVPGMPRPKFFDRRHNNGSVFISYRKPSTSSLETSETAVYERIYKHPRRQFSTKKRDEDLFYLNELLWKQCRPLSVRLKKIDIDLANHKHLAQLSPPAAAKLLNIKLTRDARKSSKWKISPSNSANTSNAEIIVDTIDLCSSDEEEERKQQREHEAEAESVVTDDNSNSSKSQDSSLSRSTTSSSIHTVLKKLNPEITLTPIRSNSDPINNNVLLETAAKVHRIEGNFVMSPTTTASTLTPPLSSTPTKGDDLLANIQNQENFDRNSSAVATVASAAMSTTLPQNKRRSDSVVVSTSKQRRTIGGITNNNTTNISNSNLNLQTQPSANATLPILQFNRIESIDLTL